MKNYALRISYQCSCTFDYMNSYTVCYWSAQVKCNRLLTCFLFSSNWSEEQQEHESWQHHGFFQVALLDREAEAMIDSQLCEHFPLPRVVIKRYLVVLHPACGFSNFTKLALLRMCRNFEGLVGKLVWFPDSTLRRDWRLGTRLLLSHPFAVCGIRWQSRLFPLEHNTKVGVLQTVS